MEKSTEVMENNTEVMEKSTEVMENNTKTYGKKYGSNGKKYDVVWKKIRMCYELRKCVVKFSIAKKNSMTFRDLETIIEQKSSHWEEK